MNLRLPTRLHAALKRLAERERRSLHGEILWLLEEGLRRHEAEHPELRDTAQ